MTKIIFTGWEAGMKKIPFIHMLEREMGLSLSESKRIKDQLVDENQILEIEVKDSIQASKIIEKCKELKVKAHIKSS
jgi:hypothetical protein